VVKNKNKLFITLFFLIVFIILNTDVCFAQLEVKYPTISGQTITSDAEFPEYAKYLFNLGMFIGFFSVFISLIISGVTYIVSNISIDARANAKDRASGAISGLLILVLTYLIVTTINPQLSFFYLNKIDNNSTSEEEKKDPGVYLNESSDCSGDTNPKTENLSDLGLQKNKIRSVNIEQNTVSKISYVSILYGNPNFRGKCQYANPNDSACTKVEPFAMSASIHQYDSSPNGDGVYF
jgi:hypothetical protein